MEYILDPLVVPIALPILAGLVCLLLPHSAQKTRSSLTVAAAALVILPESGGQSDDDASKARLAASEAGAPSLDSSVVA